MSTLELRKKLIRKVNTTESVDLLEEAYRLPDLESGDIEIYKLSKDLIITIKEAKNQIKNGRFLTDEEADKAISKWLKK